MFQSRVLLHLAKASLKVTKGEKETRKDADVHLVFEPFSEQFAHEMGEDIARHLFEDGAICPELENVTLDPRVPNQIVTVSADLDGKVELVTLRQVEFGPISVSKQRDEKSGDEWLKATIRARIDLVPKAHREWLVGHFGAVMAFAFEAEQGDLLPEEDEKRRRRKAAADSAHEFVGGMQECSVTVSAPGRPPVTITKDDVKVGRADAQAHP